MEIIECILTDSYCYQCKGAPGKYPAKPAGILVHSSGDNQAYLKRYVQPSPDDPNYENLILRLGKNKYNNSWNRNVKKSMHYMIGKDAYGKVSVAHLLPLDICAWGVANGKKGSYNYQPMYIQFEMQEGNKSAADFDAVWDLATELCAELCKRFGWTEENITSHYEAHAAGYANAHSDPKGYFAKHGLTMDDFRQRVGELLNHKPEPKKIEVGDTVDFTGTKQWTNANKLLSSKATPCKAVVKQIYQLGKSKHPYLIKGNGVYGWVNAEDVKRI